MAGAQETLHEGQFYAETYPYPWADGHVPQSTSQLPIVPSVLPRRHTNPEYEYASPRPSKRLRPEGEYSAVSTYSNYFLLQGGTDVYLPNHSFVIVGQGDTPTSDNSFWPTNEQENWPPTADASFASNTNSDVNSTLDCPPQPLICPNTVSYFSHAVFRLPIPGVGLNFSTDQSSFETSHTPSPTPQSTIVPTTYSTHFSFRAPAVPHELLPYDSAVNRLFHDGLSLPALETLIGKFPQPLDPTTASASSHASSSASAASPLENPIGYTVQGAPLHSTTSLSPSNDDLAASPTGTWRVSSSSMAPATQSPSKSLRKKRRTFDKIDKAARKETSNTRKIGACLRCRLQRVRCSDSGPGPEFLCTACDNVSSNSKKTIYRIVCCRSRLNHGALHRSNGLDYTMRFTHTEVRDVDSNSRIHIIEVTQGICKIPIRLRVRRFEPQKGDIINRRYSENGIIKEENLQPYCLADVEETANEFKAYVNVNAFSGLEEVANLKDSDELVKATFHMIAIECRALDDRGESKDEELREFLRMFVRMWFALRHESSVGWLCGSETLGAQLGKAQSPRPAIPRMIVAQFDSIRHERIFKNLVPPVLKKMEKYLLSQDGDAWFTVYLASFLLLHQVSVCSSDRSRWARDNASRAMPLETRYGPITHPFTTLVENIQECASTLLIHWQFFIKQCDLMNIPWKSPGRTQLRSLKAYQLEFMRNTVELVKQKKAVVPTSPSEGCWDHELFWILQLFGSPDEDSEDRWHPPERFSRALHTVGRNGGWPYYS